MRYFVNLCWNLSLIYNIISLQFLHSVCRNFIITCITDTMSEYIESPNLIF